MLDVSSSQRTAEMRCDKKNFNVGIRELDGTCNVETFLLMHLICSMLALKSKVTYLLTYQPNQNISKRLFSFFSIEWNAFITVFLKNMIVSEIHQ